MTTDEGDPFDRAVAREMEIRERQQRVETQRPRREGVRAGATCFVGIAVFFPLIYFFAWHITWVLVIYFFLLASAVAVMVMEWLLPASAFEKKRGTDENEGDTGGSNRVRVNPMTGGWSYGHRNKYGRGGSLGFAVFLAALLPLTLIFGSNVTWLVITHVVLLAMALSGAVSSWNGALGFSVLLGVLLPLTLTLGGHITWLVILHVVFIAISLSGAASTAWSGQLGFFVLLTGLLPLTLTLGRHITWLVVTHLILLAIALSSMVSMGFRGWGGWSTRAPRL